MSRIDRIEKKTDRLYEKLGEAKSEFSVLSDIYLKSQMSYSYLSAEKVLAKTRELSLLQQMKYDRAQNRIARLENRIDKLKTKTAKILRNQVESYR